MSLIPISPSMVLLDTGADFDADLTLQEWQEIGAGLGRYTSRLRWSVGDWMLYGTERFGRDALMAAADSDIGEKTIADAVVVCSSIPRTDRRADLSFGHHAAVAHLGSDDRQRMLSTAAAEQLTLDGFHDLIDQAAPAKPKPITTTRAVRLIIDGDLDESEMESLSAALNAAMERWFVEQGIDERAHVRKIAW